MKKLLFAFVLISNVVVAQSELPKCVDVHITEFIQYYKIKSRMVAIFEGLNLKVID